MQNVFSSFFDDKDVIDAKNLLIEKYTHYQSFIQSVKPGKGKNKVSFKKVLDEMSNLRGGSLFYPYLGSGIGNGALVELVDGSVKYDMISGIGAHWGHSTKEQIEGQLDAAFQDITIQGNLQQNINTKPVLELFLKLSGMDHCFLTTSGAMAAENGLKLCFQKHAPATRIFAFEKCFMGRTLALSYVTDKAAYRQGLPQTVSVDYLPFYDENEPEKSTQLCLAAIQQYVKRFPGQHAMLCAELIQGEGGYYPGNKTFFRKIMRALKKHDIAIFVDEIQTFGRTPSVFAFKEFGISDLVDVVSVGKLSQVCATLFRKDYKPKPGLISQTFTSSSAALEVSRRILEALNSRAYSGKNGKIAVLSTYFRKKLVTLSKKYPSKIEGPFGYGMMLACTPFKGDANKVLTFCHRLFESGVIAFIAGDSPKRCRFLPPIGGVNQDDIDRVIEIIETILKKPL